jgi:hypothetical protein
VYYFSVCPFAASICTLDESKTCSFRYIAHDDGKFTRIDHHTMMRNRQERTSMKFKEPLELIAKGIRPLQMRPYALPPLPRLLVWQSFLLLLL